MKVKILKLTKNVAEQINSYLEDGWELYGEIKYLSIPGYEFDTQITVMVTLIKND